LSAIDPAEALRRLVKLLARDAARRAHATTDSAAACVAEISEMNVGPGSTLGNEDTHAEALPR
jgi:hypothetical protein